MTFTDKLSRLLNRPLRATPRVPISLVKAAPFTPLPAPITPAGRDFDLVCAEWHRLEVIYPGMTWPAFLHRLEDNYRFHAEERDARRQRLAQLDAQRKPLP